MSAIVKANSSLTAGGLAVLKRTFSADKDNKITYSADYVCLAQFAAANATRFQKNSTPPTPIPAAMQRFGIVETPKLYDLTTETINGLTYFRPVYVATGNSNSSFFITRSSEQRTFQGSVSRVITTGEPGFLAQNPVTDTLSFDYISVTETVTSNNSTLPPVKGSAGKKFNERQARTFAFSGVSISDRGSVLVETDVIENSSETRNSDGTMSYTVSSSGIYVQSKLQPTADLSI